LVVIWRNKKIRSNNSFFSPSEENLGIKVLVEEEPNQSALTPLCVSDHLLSFVIIVDKRDAIKA